MTFLFCDDGTTFIHTEESGSVLFSLPANTSGVHTIGKDAAKYNCRKEVFEAIERRSELVVGKILQEPLEEGGTRRRSTAPTAGFAHALEEEGRHQSSGAYQADAIAR